MRKLGFGLLFVAAFLAALLITFPHELLVRRYLTGPLSEAGLDVTIDDVGFSLPIGLKVRGLKAAGDGGGIGLESVYVGLLGGIDIRGCGGRIRADIDRSPLGLSLELQSIDPAECLRVGDLLIRGTFDGEVELEDIEFGGEGVTLPDSGEIRFAATDGSFGGVLPAAKGQAGVGLGEWTFDSVELAADIEDGRLTIADGRGMAEGLELEVRNGTLGPSKRGQTPIAIEFVARAAAKTNRAKAVLGMLPKATEGSGGWRTYRIRGTVEKPELIGLK